MSRLALPLALLLLAAPARAWRLWGEPSDKKIRPVQALSDARKPAEVVAALTPEFMQTLRGTDLRQAYVLKGDNLDLLGRVDEALGVYQLGVSLFPKNVDLLTRQGDLLHRTGLDEQARVFYLRALVYEPRHFGAHLGLAEIDRRLGFLDRSASHYETALETLDGRADVWRSYAETLLAQRDWTTGDLAIARAIALEPENPEGLVLTAFTRRAQGDMAGALAALDEALTRGGGVGVLRAKALWLVEAGLPEQALAQAALVLKESPDDGAALWARARALLALGRGAEAQRELAPLAAPARADLAARAARALRDAIPPGTASR
ncbi:MAG: tetratricopeptide repeat protein [Elusimicrobia bacterium]|nr:tetratricopeptide repeat protein [Elusimicrobiota bacterium]